MFILVELGVQTMAPGTLWTDAEGPTSSVREGRAGEWRDKLPWLSFPHPDQVVTRNCTKQQNLVCTCRADMYCALPGKSDSCRQCMRLNKCGPGFGVASASKDPLLFPHEHS